VTRLVNQSRGRWAGAVDWGLSVRRVLLTKMGYFEFQVLKSSKFNSYDGWFKQSVPLVDLDRQA